MEALREQYRRRDAAALAWKAGGGRIVGYLCDNVPEELIIAAGFLPYRLSGDPAEGHDTIERYVQPYAPPFSARNRGVGFSDAMLNMLLRGRFAFLDYLVVPHTRKAIQAYYRELTLAHQAHPELPLPELFYLDRAYTPFYASEVFNRERVMELRVQLDTWSGRPITTAALAEAVAVVNESKELLRQVAALRTADPPRLSGVDALQVIGASQFMPKADFNQLLRQLLADPPPHLPGADVRVFIGGSPVDHLQLYELVEACGATIVAEDHCWGKRCSEFSLDPTPHPFEAVADRYHRKPACSIAFPIGTVVGRCLERALAARVDGAIFFVYEGDGVHVWDTPDEIRALEQHGIGSLHLARQPYRIDDPDRLRVQVEAFIQSLKASVAAS
jgi:benzoyl-CoA reductase/2-hydroxyglutaryl-CoA dehydratase subunit BcrC/BadD/HgdB